MTTHEIISKVKELHLPKDSYVVYGSCPLTVAGIREANDIDLLVSTKLFNDLITQGWKETVKGDKDEPVVKDVFEAHENWNFSSYSPTLQHLLSSATIVDGVPFAALDEVRKWKAAATKPKHQRDVKLIDEYLAGTT